MGAGGPCERGTRRPAEEAPPDRGTWRPIAQAVPGDVDNHLMSKTTLDMNGHTGGATIAGVAKISISLDDDLYQRVRLAAGKEGVSAWLAATAEARLRRDILREVANEIAEETGGPFTEQEREEARKWLFSSSTQAP